MANEPDTAYTLADLMPARRVRRSKRPWMIAAAVAATVAVVAGVVALAWAVRPGVSVTRALGPLKADAARGCRDAIGAEARTRADTVNRRNDAAAVSVADITVDEPGWGDRPHAWTVDGTFKFSVVSLFGVIPGSVDVRCTASRSSGGQLVTSVANR